MFHVILWKVIAFRACDRVKNMEIAHLLDIIKRYKSDPESVYNTWFITSEERMKAFRSIRRGIQETVKSITEDTFGNDFKGSVLEFVLTAITEQKQVFEGAAHPFYWKPKLRIPDIYENRANQLTFGQFLETCLAATREDQLVDAMHRLASAQIKGVGPAAANIVYFLHPTLVPPFNTAMVNGFNALFNDKKKLGSWESYLAMRETILRTNAHPEIRPLLSKDLGAFAGMLFELGIGRLLIENNVSLVLDNIKAQAEKASRLRHEAVAAEEKAESEHTEIQYLLIKIGRALHFDVYVARNDRHRSYKGQSFALLTVPELPANSWGNDVMETVSLIDVIWLKPGTGEIVCAFEVEKSTSIYSGILRMEDLARSIPGCTCNFYLVAPNKREIEVMAQFARPSFRTTILDMSLAFIPFNDLRHHCDGICQFGDDHTIMHKIARHYLPA